MGYTKVTARLGHCTSVLRKIRGLLVQVPAPVAKEYPIRQSRCLLGNCLHRPVTLRPWLTPGLPLSDCDSVRSEQPACHGVEVTT
jgi:hypothetical protein